MKQTEKGRRAGTVKVKAVTRPDGTNVYTKSVNSELTRARDKAAELEEVFRFTVLSHYEETNLINVADGTVRPLLTPKEGRTGGIFESSGYHYDEGIRRMIENGAASEEDGERLKVLFLGELVPALRAEGSVTVRCRIKDGQGGVSWKQIECTFFRDGEQEILLLVSDVQEEENIREQLREAAEEAEAANRAKSAFLANMSHEIRTPMNAIVGISEILLGKDLPKDVRMSLATIQNSGSSLLGIINDILDFSKIETGKFEITDAEYMLPSLLMDISNMISVRLAGKPVYFMMDVDPKLPNHFTGDDIRLKQILMNLIGNAVKFTREGYIDLRVRGHFLEGDRYELKFEVKDSGIGIKEEDLGKLFNSFTQVDTRKNRATQGSGLGLTISRNLANLMGGDLTVQSVYGKGSIFTVHVVHRVPRYVPIGEVHDKERVKMLICERNESIIHGLKGAAENLGLACEICREPDRVRHYRDCTHVLIRRAAFAALREKLEFMFDRDNIYLILENDEQPESNYMEYKQLQLPLITLQLINALNGEEIVSSIKKTSFDRSQIIPLTFAHVLVVDDNTTNLQVAQGLMLPYKMKVDVATSGFKAIEMVQNTHYDAIFMDHMMPEMDGIEAAKYIRGMKGDYYKEVPIIALTANAMSDAKDMFLEAGMNDFVAKPIEMRQLHRVIRKYIQSRAPEGYLEKMAKAEGRKAAGGSGKAAAADGAASAQAVPAGRIEAVPGMGGVHLGAVTAVPGAGAAPFGGDGAAGSAFTQLLVQNNALLAQNMQLLGALLGNIPAGVSGISPAGAAAPAYAGGPEAYAMPGDAVREEDGAAAGDALEESGRVAEELRDFIPGVDMQKSIETYGGSIEIYHSILKTYYADIRNQVKLIGDLYGKRDTKNFTIQVHAVKSASRGVGANDLGEEAYQLELAGKAEDWARIDELYPQFAADLRQMTENVGKYAKKYLSSGDAAGEEGASPEEREPESEFDPELLSELKTSCMDMDYLEAERVLEKLRRKSYPESLDRKLDEMLEAANGYDYDRLEQLVEEL